MQPISRIRLHLLGGFTVFPDGTPDEPLSIPSRKARGLLAYLAMQREMSLTREQLAALLWANRFDKQARQSLRQSILSLRKQLEPLAPGLLVLDGERVGLDTQLFSTDAGEFSVLAEQGADLERALALYRGEFLAGFSLDVEPFDNWVRAERARLVAIAARLIELQASADPAPAAPAAEPHRTKLTAPATLDLNNADAVAPMPEPAPDVRPRAEPMFEPQPAAAAPDWRSKIRHAWPLAALAGVGVLAIFVSRSWLLAPHQSLSASVDHERRAAAVVRGPGRIFKDCEICPEMVELPAGAFMMGSPEDERGRAAVEGPRRRVVIGKRFALGRLEVTVDQLKAFVMETGASVGNVCHTIDPNTAYLRRPDVSFGQPGYAFTGAHPAVCVSWHEAQAYVAWLGRRTGKSYRLPSEAEWEYAARVGTTTSYSFGDDETRLCHYARFADLASSFAWRGGCRGAADTHGPLQAGALEPNAWGLFDMHGNVWEWVADCWTADAREIPTDGSAFTRPCYCQEGVIRGGGWNSAYVGVRSARRLHSTAASRSNSIGLRVALSLQPP